MPKAVWFIELPPVWIERELKSGWSSAARLPADPPREFFDGCSKQRRQAPMCFSS
jgi:hypothetical protein